MDPHLKDIMGSVPSSLMAHCTWAFETGLLGGISTMSGDAPKASQSFGMRPFSRTCHRFGRVILPHRFTGRAA